MLRQCSYRDEEHRSRSLRSYQVERAFYAHAAPLLQARGVPLPHMHASAWSDDCLQGVTVLEDLSSPPGHPPTSGAIGSSAPAPRHKRGQTPHETRSTHSAGGAACAVRVVQPSASRGGTVASYSIA